jgi:predicted transcriptional regulator
MKRKLDLRGDLQAEVMAAVWKLGEAKVEDVRAQQPARRRSAYTTIQTVMGRLVERGLLTRERRGNAFVYRARYGEADYVSRAVGARLAAASSDARSAALQHLVGGLDEAELEDIAGYIARIQRARAGGDDSA